jgi:hypothetical protein
MTALQTDEDREVRVMTVRCPSRLIAAMERAASSDFISVSDVIRLGVSGYLRDRGHLDPNAA